MATIVQGDTLSLSKLGIATGQTTYSMGICAGSIDTPILMSEFAIDSVSEIVGFTYVVENTSELYSLTFNGNGSRFTRIAATPVNFTWDVNFAGDNTTNYFTISASPNSNATLTAGDLNPQDPSAQTDLMTVREHLLSVTFADDFNDHIGVGGNYNVARTKTIYVVDTYDGNTALCLTADSPIIMSDGSVLEIGDLEEGDKLKGFKIGGLGINSDENFLDWETDELQIFPKEVTVVNVVFSFSNRIFNINNGEIRGTFEHPMLVRDINDNRYRFKILTELKIGDKLIKENEEIEIFSIVPENEIEEIVSIDVEVQDTYLVNGYVTHNKGGNTSGGGL